MSAAPASPAGRDPEVTDDAAARARDIVEIHQHVHSRGRVAACPSCQGLVAAIAAALGEAPAQEALRDIVGWVEGSLRDKERPWWYAKARAALSRASGERAPGDAA